uniref:Peptidase C14, caspase catalytic subunit p20 n=1 Tax=Rhodopseudomonas palustris (strain BisA53) TaxID=316055 RepID=Q07QQ7_RHOP5
MIDRGLDQLSKDIDDFAERVRGHGPKAVALLFYAGHGVESDAVNYLIPVSAKIEKSADIGAQGLSVESVAKKLAKNGNGLNIIVVDACRDNPFPRASTQIATNRGLSPMAAVHGVFIASSTGSGKVAFDGEGSNSVYTMRLAEAIDASGEKLEDVFKSVRRRVRLDTSGQQIPWESTAIEFDFFFLPPLPKPTPAAQLYSAAKETGNQALFDLLINRFPDSPEAEDARKLRQSGEADRWEADNSGAELVLERARNAKSPEAFDLVTILFPRTPQAEEARLAASRLREASVLASSGPEYSGRELVFHLREQLMRLHCSDMAPGNEFDATTIRALRRATLLTDDRFLWHKPTMAALRALQKVNVSDGCNDRQLLGRSACLRVAGDALCP